MNRSFEQAIEQLGEAFRNWASFTADCLDSYQVMVEEVRALPITN